MKQLRIGDISIDAVIEREGPWRRPQDFFPAYDEAVFKRHLPTMEPEVFDSALGMMVITYQTFVLRTPRYTILVDTCTGEHKGHPPPFDFPGKERWRNELFALGIAYDKVDYVFCTHLHIDHTGWNTTLRDGRWVPTFPNAKYIFHKREYAAWEAEHARGANPPGTVFRDNCLPIVEAGQALLVDDDYALDDTITLTPTPGHSPCHCCVNIFSHGQRAVVTGDMMHHVIQCREPDWSPRSTGIQSKRRYRAESFCPLWRIPIRSFCRSISRPRRLAWSRRTGSDSTIGLNAGELPRLGFTIRHGRALSRPSTSSFTPRPRTWMPGTSSAKTRFALLPGHDVKDPD